jgi:hypothetical protein
MKAQQLVCGVLGDWMGKEIHAPGMKTFAPGGWGARRAEASEVHGGAGFDSRRLQPFLLV